MSPDRRDRRKASTPRSKAPAVRTAASSDDAHAIVFFKRHKDDDPDQRAPGRDALNSYPPGVRAKMRSVLVAVATAPPKRFAGGGYWEAMKGDMSGWFEVRWTGRDVTTTGSSASLTTTPRARTSPSWLSSTAETNRSGRRCRRPTTPRSGGWARSTAAATHGP